MKKLLIIYLTLCISFSAFSHIHNNENDSIKYFNHAYFPISKTDYENRKSNGNFWTIPGGSTNHRILAYKGLEGIVNNKPELDSVLASATNRKINPTKPIIIMYYPGKDLCNSSGTATRKHFKKWYEKMEKRAHRIKESTIIYAYKNDDGLYDKYDGGKEWIKDPEQYIESLFFDHHYPCSSFVIISETGKFISHFGEAPYEYIWETLKKLKK